MTIQIIKLNNKKAKPRKETCFNCGTVFTYESSDTEYDQREQSSYVVCPNKKCKQFISVKS